MSSIHVALRPAASSSGSEGGLDGLLDLWVDGINVTARATDTQGLTLLAELAQATAGLRRGRLSRARAQLCADGDAWELGLEADGDFALLTVYRSGPAPEVTLHERRLSLVDLDEALRGALDEALTRHLPPGHRGVLESARAQLERAHTSAKPLPRNLVQDRVVVKTASGMEMQADASFRLGDAAPPETSGQVERADLHALLVPGRFRIAIGRRGITIARAHLFLLAERLVWLAEDAFESFQSSRPLFRRLQVEGLRIGVRRGPGNGNLALTIAMVAGDADRTLTLNELDTTDFVEAAALYAEALCDRFVAHDPRQRNNLRLSVLRESALGLRERLRELRLDDSLSNPEPDSYRSYGLPAVAPKLEGPLGLSADVRFTPKWVAAVPNVDLRSTLLVQDHFIVGSARELACLDPRSGQVRWRFSSERAATVATPHGIARLSSDGRLRLHALENGEVKFSTKLTPRSGGGAAGALVSSPGLPRLLLVAEGDRTITAVELQTGEVRWRHHASRASHFRLKRAGRLVLLTGGDSALSALDVVTGETVWRVRDRLPFTGDISVTGDSAFALSASAAGLSRLHHIELWTGRLLWSAELDEQAVPGQAPLATETSVVVATKDRRGTGLSAVDRASGAPLWTQEPGLSATNSSHLGLPDAVVVNSASGTLLCVDAESGHVRYSHVFSRQLDADQPRRLDPILQNGALFVPQHQVQILRPGDGEILGELPNDVIADWMRVDAQGSVYVAEESGHLAAYAVAPRLRLVR